jgi:hypothetical protein
MTEAFGGSLRGETDAFKAYHRLGGAFSRLAEDSQTVKSYAILRGSHSTISWKKYVPSTASIISKNKGNAVRAM